MRPQPFYNKQKTPRNDARDLVVTLIRSLDENAPKFCPEEIQNQRSVLLDMDSRCLQHPGIGLQFNA